MVTKTVFEERILREIQDLPESAQERLAKLICFFKHEILDQTDSSDAKLQKLLSVFGTWEDTRSIEEQIRDIHDSRTSSPTRLPLT